MTEPQMPSEMAATTVLNGWIGRHDLARELGLSVDTLGRWEARRIGPPCVRAGRRVFYRRSAVQDWLQAQEMPRAKRAAGSRT
jgi:predicted DNA-binding transcriptional regulator AlpA